MVPGITRNRKGVVYDDMSMGTGRLSMPPLPDVAIYTLDVMADEGGMAALRRG